MRRKCLKEIIHSQHFALAIRCIDRMPSVSVFVSTQLTLCDVLSLNVLHRLLAFLLRILYMSIHTVHCILWRIVLLLYIYAVKQRHGIIVKLFAKLFHFRTYIVFVLYSVVI